MAEESSIIRRVIDGDVEAFRLLVQRYQKPVISMINHLTNNQHSSEDIAQEVFFSVYKKLKSFDADRSMFSTWIFTIARNKAISAGKKKKPQLRLMSPQGL